jgi:hypothetical protein
MPPKNINKPFQSPTKALLLMKYMPEYPDVSPANRSDSLILCPTLCAHLPEAEPAAINSAQQRRQRCTLRTSH